MSTSRAVQSIIQSTPTMEGAGVQLRRAFGRADPRLDPFLLLDDFGSEFIEDFIAGFPWHPHRGIETITYVLSGEVKHGDSLGSSGVIGPGEVQWMTAGSGIIHEEMPLSKAPLKGLQLWSNLPASHKMMKPRYRDVKADQIPVVNLETGVDVRVICGEIDGVSGPVGDIVTAPRYLDVTIEPSTSCTLPVLKGHNAFAYVVEGAGTFGPNGDIETSSRHLVVFDDGDEVLVRAGDRGPARFLLVSGKPIGEPVAWGGPIVMNTQEELQTAFMEYRSGTFIKQ